MCAFLAHIVTPGAGIASRIGASRFFARALEPASGDAGNLDQQAGRTSLTSIATDPHADPGTKSALRR
jgi:hypothetical protein